MMHGFPPEPEAQVTTENWRLPPQSRWGFCNMRQLFPTAGLTRSSCPSHLLERPSDLAQVLLLNRVGVERPLDTILREENTNGFIVLHKGKIVMEWYDGFLKSNTLHTVQSISKSIAALVAGILIERKCLSDQANVIDYIPELAHSGFGSAKVRHLLDMTTSLAFNEDLADPNGDSVKFRSATTGTPKREDVKVIGLRKALQQIGHGGGAHGDRFHYVTANTDVLGWVLERASGRPYVELVQELLWDPLGAEHEACLLLDVYAAPRAGGGISMTLRDLARVGEMIRCMGSFNNHQIVPKRWLQDMLANGDKEAWARGPRSGVIKGPYRSNFYLLGAGNEPLLAGIGSYGQWLYVDIARDTVIARFASESVGTDPIRLSDWQRIFYSIACQLDSKVNL